MKKLKLLVRNIVAKAVTQVPQIQVMPPSDLTGQVILITGASSGLGLATAKQLHELGACVVGVSPDKEGLQKNFPQSERALAIVGDVTNAKDVHDMFTKTIKKFGHLDVLINNAGLFSEKLLEKTPEKEFDLVMNVNVKGVFLTCHEVLPYFKERHKGLIINIGSKISHNTAVTKQKVLYATTKYAVEGFSLALRNELFGTGVRVTCLMSATMNTFPSLESHTYLETAEMASVIAHIIHHPHIQYEHLLLQSIGQQL